MSSARYAAAIGVLALAGALVAAPTAGAKVRTVPKSGVVKVGTVRCAAQEACVVKPTPKRIAAKVAGKKVKVRVVVPSFLGAGGKAAVKLRFGTGALERLAGHSAVFRGRVVVHGSGKKSSQLFKATLGRPAAPPTKPGAGTGGTVGGNGGANGEGAHSEPVAGEAPALPRPLTAVTVQSASVKWYPRASWIRYVATGEGTTAFGGALTVNSSTSACPAVTGSREGAEPPPSGEFPYEVDFAPAESWYDPASGTAAIDGTGGVTFRYKAHTINLTGSEPEIQINGSSSQAVFRFSGSEGTPYPNQRVALLSLDTAGQPTVTNGGKTLEYNLMRGTLTENGEKVFAGFYPAPTSNGFGCVSASFTLP